MPYRQGRTKGKGKGKTGKNNFGKNGDLGKGGGAPTAAATAAAAAKKAERDRLWCTHCLIKGHTVDDCRKKKAGLPAKTRPARSLEQADAANERPGDWTYDVNGGERERGLGALDLDCGCLDFE